jgi:hypothetical protein
VTFAAPSSGASATFAATGCTSNPEAYECVATTNTSGQATSSTFTAGSTPLGSYSITASATGASSASFSESNVATAISSLVTANAAGNTATEIESGDTITITFSAQIDAKDVCSSWTNGLTTTQSASTGSVVTVTPGSGDSDNVLSFTTPPSACTTFNFGSIDLGTNHYVTGGSLTFTSSTISYNGNTDTLQITLGTSGGTGTIHKVTTSVLTLTLSGVDDTGGNSLSDDTLATANEAQF